MKISLLALLLLCAFSAVAQDTIVKRDKDVIIARIIEVRADDVLYRKASSPDGPKYAVNKNQLAEVRYANGVAEDYSGFTSGATSEKKRSLAETKDYIVRTINEYGHKRNSDVRRLEASFEGDLLRIKTLSKNGKPYDEGELYDFATALKFQAVDRRDGNIGILNIWVHTVADARKSDSEKVKLVIELRDQDAAHELRQALMHLNLLLRQAVSKVEKF